VLGQIRRCYEELDKFWIEEIGRAETAFLTGRVDPGDVERWRNFKTSLEKTIESWTPWKVWFRFIPLDGEETKRPTLSD
jgi:hypothetical protein